MTRYLYVICIGLIMLGCEAGDFDDELQISIPVSIEEVKKGPIEEFITTTSTQPKANQKVLRKVLRKLMDLVMMTVP